MPEYPIPAFLEPVRDRLDSWSLWDSRHTMTSMEHMLHRPCPLPIAGGIIGEVVGRIDRDYRRGSAGRLVVHYGIHESALGYLLDMLTYLTGGGGYGYAATGEWYLARQRSGSLVFGGAYYLASDHELLRHRTARHTPPSGHRWLTAITRAANFNPAAAFQTPSPTPDPINPKADQPGYPDGWPCFDPNDNEEES